MQIPPFFKKVLFGLMLIVTVRSQASVIYSYSNLLVAGNNPSSPTYTFSFGIDVGPDIPLNVGAWDIPLLTINSFSNESAWGKTFVLNAGNNPNFDAFVAQLTNGTTDILGLSMVTSPNYAYQYFSEPSYFFPSGGPGIDLIGNTITQIEISFVEDRTVEVPGVFIPDFEARYTVTYLNNPVAAVPETSSTLYLLGIAVIPAFLWQIRRARAD